MKNADEALAKLTEQAELVKTLQAQIAAKDGELAKFKDFDPDAMRASLGELTETLRGEREERGVQISDWATNVDKLTAQNEKQRKALEGSLIVAEMSAAIVRKKGNPEMLLPFAQLSARMEETSDGYRTYVVDAAGNKLVNSKTLAPMTFDDYVSETLIVKYPAMFLGTGASGSGAGRSVAPGSFGYRRSIDGSDSKAYLANVEDIAAGRVDVK